MVTIWWFHLAFSDSCEQDLLGSLLSTGVDYKILFMVISRKALIGIIFTSKYRLATKDKEVERKKVGFDMPMERCELVRTGLFIKIK